MLALWWPSQWPCDTQTLTFNSINRGWRVSWLGGAAGGTSRHCPGIASTALQQVRILKRFGSFLGQILKATEMITRIRMYYLVVLHVRYRIIA